MVLSLNVLVSPLLTEKYILRGSRFKIFFISRKSFLFFLYFVSSMDYTRLRHYIQDKKKKTESFH